MERGHPTRSLIWDREGTSHQVTTSLIVFKMIKTKCSKHNGRRVVGVGCGVGWGCGGGGGDGVGGGGGGWGWRYNHLVSYKIRTSIYMN